MRIKNSAQMARISAMSCKVKILYYTFGVLAVVALVTAYWSPWQRLNQVLVTAGICGMMAMSAQQDICKDKKAYFLQHFWRDLSVLLVWCVLLFIWVCDQS